MVRRKLFILMFAFLLISCTTKNIPSNSLGKDSTGIYKRMPIGKIQEALQKNDNNTVMLYLDTRNPRYYKKEIIDTNKVFQDFGRSLEKHGILFDVTTIAIKNYTKRRRYLDKVQQQLKKDFGYNESPFLIFLKKTDEGHRPYRILSFNEVPTKCIDSNLGKIEKAIVTNKGEKEIYASLNQLTLASCGISGKLSGKLGFNFNAIINNIKSRFKNVW